MHGHKRQHAKGKGRARYWPATQPPAGLEVELHPAGQGLPIGFFGAGGIATGSRVFVPSGSRSVSFRSPHSIFQDQRLRKDRPMKFRNRKAYSFASASLALVSTLALSACDAQVSSPPAGSSTSASPAASATSDPSVAASPTGGADEMHDRMETDHRQGMDHDAMRRGAGTNTPDTTHPSPQPTGTDSPMPSGGMQDM